jgi:hypothetical protein
MMASERGLDTKRMQVDHSSYFLRTQIRDPQVKIMDQHYWLASAQVQNSIGWIVAPGRVTKMTYPTYASYSEPVASEQQSKT